MRKSILLAVILGGVFVWAGAQEQHEVTVRNIEVPVRVFSGNQFVFDLKKEDFEIYEDGVLQDIEALYLTNRNTIIRKEEGGDFVPQTSRHYYLLFQIIEYDPKLEKSIDYFFKEVLLPGDTVLLMTPKKNYFLSADALNKKPREAVSKEMQKILRKDTKIGASAYRSQMRTLQSLVNSISGGGRGATDYEADIGGASSSLGMLLRRYRSALEKMDELRFVDQKLFLEFASKLKQQPGQKYLYFFYEREFRPELSSSVMNSLISSYQGEPSVIGDLQDIFQFYHRAERVDTEKIKNAFADASICFNFLFVDREARGGVGISMREQSEDYYNAFTQTAQATGGVISSSMNPSAGFMEALSKGEKYYLLYYSPKNYKADNSFKTIEVRVKSRDCKLLYRKGYYAN